MVATAPGTKSCCQCGKDLAGAPRKKDVHSRYWCIPCDGSERRMARLGFEETVSQTPSLTGDGSAERARLVKMLSLMGGMAALALVFHLFIFK